MFYEISVEPGPPVYWKIHQFGPLEGKTKITTLMHSDVYKDPRVLDSLASWIPSEAGKGHRKDMVNVPNTEW